MARRRTRVESSGDVMPAELLEAGSPIARREWYAARQVYDWRGQYAAITAARAAHGIVTPDPRLAMTRWIGEQQHPPHLLATASVGRQGNPDM